MNMTTGGLNSAMAAGYAQIYLPYPYVAAMFPGYWSGYAMEWNIVLHFLTISITHFVLFKFLRTVALNRSLAFFLSTVTLYSTGMLFPFFYGSALDAWTGHLFLCAVIGLFFHKPSGIKGPLLIIFATYWLICSGHAEVMYYGLLSVGIFTILLPFFEVAIFSDRKIKLKTVLSFWLHTGMYCAVGLALSSVYVIPFYFEIVKKLLLAHQNYALAGGLADTFLGCASNVFSPLRASVMASFGGNPLLPALILIPVLRLFRVKIPAVIWITTGAIIIISLGTLGERLPVHRLLWQYLPFASATRLSGRPAIMLPVLFMLLSIWVLHNSKIPRSFARFKTSPLQFLTWIAILPYLIYILFIVVHPLKNDLFPFSLINIVNIPVWVEPLTLITNIILLFAVTYYASGICTGKTGLFLCALTVLHIVLLFKYYPMPRMLIENKDRPTFQQFLEQKQEKMAVLQSQYLFPFDAATAYDISTIPQLENYFLEPHLGKIYRKYLVAVTRDDAYRILNTTRQQDEVVVEGYRPKAERGPKSLSSTCEDGFDSVMLSYSSYNKMTFNVRASVPAFFVLSYTRTRNWQATLDGVNVPTYRANGYAQAVHLPAGEHIIEFRYWSWAWFWGMTISCVVLSLIGLVVGIRMGKPVGLFTAVATTIAAVGIFFLWYHSLYTGKNLGTVYEWRSGPPGMSTNLAYGKQTVMSSCYPDTPYQHNSRHAVDGDRSLSSCFITGDEEFPWWEVDLRKPEKISKIVLYTSLQGEEYDKMIVYYPDNFRTILHKGSFALEKKPVFFNCLPLTIAVSTDHEHWQAAQLHAVRNDAPITIQPAEEPITARYIKITASGKCRLSLNEVEIYAP
ncbi:MAG: hypothetical protein SWH61_17670 [Thermodesulfobacteriota bacterium]|nr:hypothetical protein [Thermodesulfobacteriota bacterium]